MATHTDAPDERVALSRAFELQQAGRLADAEVLYAQVLARAPDDTTALVNGGALAVARGDLQLAIARFERVVRMAPANAAAQSNLGFALLRAGRDDEALAALDRAIALLPDYAQAHNNRGIALLRLRRPDDALAAFERAATLDPRFAEAALNLGEQYNLAGEGGKAAAAYDRALTLAPARIEAVTGRAFAQAQQGDLAGAAAALAMITGTHPGNAAAWQTLGAVRNWAWDHAGAEEAFRRALALDPANDDAAFGIASTLLARGDFTAGWRAFERRPDRGAESGTAFARLPVWDGAPLAGTLVVHGEQGLGDTVQFARFLADARQRVGRLALLLDGYRAPLAPLLASAAGVDLVATDAADAAIVDATARVSVLSLPDRLGIGGDRLAPNGPYLAPPAERTRAWRARTGGIATPRVGLAWSVLVRDTHGFVTRQRLLPIAALRPLVTTPGVSFVTLQPGAAGNPAAFGADAARIVDLRDHVRDFADTAALIDTLDLVVTADTAVAHVAGALGKPVWMFDRFNACWRWRLATATTPWYPTLRIFRQERFGDWSGVARRLAAAFAERYR